MKEKFDFNPNENHRNNNKDNDRNDSWKTRTKVKTCVEFLDMTTNGNIDSYAQQKRK